MVIFRRSLGGHLHTVYQHNQTQDIVHLTSFSSLPNNSSSSTNEALRTWYNILSRSIIMDQWGVRINSNSNVSDGAQYISRINGANQPMVIIIDQATGNFLNNTQSISLPSGNYSTFIYSEGSVGGTANSRTWILRTDIGEALS